MTRRKPFPANRHSIKKLEAEGWCVATVEQTIPHCFIKRDFCNFADLIAFCPSKGIMAVQVTGGKSSSNGLARLRKIKAEPRAGLWLSSGGRIQVHDWRGNGGKRECFVTEVLANDSI